MVRHHFFVSSPSRARIEKACMGAAQDRIEKIREETEKKEREARLDRERQADEFYERWKAFNKYSNENNIVPYWKNVIEDICKQYGMTIDQVNYKSKKLHLVAIRHYIMYEIYTKTNLSFSEIGRRLDGLHHTTVFHGVMKHAEKHGLPKPTRRCVNGYRAKTQDEKPQSDDDNNG